MYCGDETGAFVGDCGLTSCRFGFGGEDCPKASDNKNAKKYVIAILCDDGKDKKRMIR